MQNGDISRNILHRYRFVKEIGRGGMGRVVLVQDLEAGGKHRALKWVDAHSPATIEEKRHLREFRILSRFRHPHILQVHHFYRVQPAVGQYFIADHLAGPSLAQLFSEQVVDDALGRVLLVQLLRAFEFIHENGWIHCDLKPANVLLRRPLHEAAAECCLIDFGIAHREHHVPDKNIMGTVYYIAPERIIGARVDRRSDLYALGVLAFQMFTGSLPFPGEDKGSVLEAHLRREPPRPTELRPDLAPAMEELILRLLAKKPGDRPAKATEVLDFLRKNWGDPSVPETPATVSAYVQSNDCTGWEEDVRGILGKVAQRALGLDSDGGGYGTSDDLDAPPPGLGEILPLEAPATGESRAGLVVVRNGTALDLAACRDHIQRRVEALGLPQIHVAGRNGEPVAELLRNIVAYLPAARAEAAQEAMKLAALVEKREGDPKAQVGEIATWLGNLATDFPLVVIMDRFEAWDAHFFELLSAVVRAERRLPGLAHVVWIAFQYDAPGLLAGQWLSSAEGRYWSTSMQLRSLDPDGIRRWLESRLPGCDPPAAFRALLEEESEGSPALLARLLSSMVEEGTVTKGWEGWVLAEEEALKRRTPLVRRTAESFATLGDEARRALTTLELLGGRADFEWLQKSAKGDVSYETLQTLDHDGWIEKEPGGNRFRFRYYFQRKAVRESLSPETWVEGNREVAEGLVRREREGRTVDPGRLASHLLAAGATVAASPYAQRAARAAAEEGRTFAAIRWLERALEAGDRLDPGEELTLVSELGDLREQWGPPAEILRLRRRAIELVQTRKQTQGDPEDVLALTRKLAHVEGSSGDFAVAEKRLLDEIAALQSAGAWGEIRRVLMNLAQFSLYRADINEASAYLAKLKSLPPAADRLLAAQETELRVECAVHGGRTTVAATLLSEAIDTLDREVDAKCAAWAVYFTAWRYQLTEGWLMALHAFRLAAYEFWRRGEVFMQARALMRMGELALLVERVDGAIEYLERAEALFRRVGAEAELPRIAWSLGSLLMRRGLFKEANEYLQRALRWSRRYPSTPWGWCVHLLQAGIHIRAGRLGQARELLDGAAHPNAAPHRHRPEPWLEWGRLAFELALRRGDLREAMARVDQTLVQVRESGGMLAQIPVWFLRWRLLQATGASHESTRLTGQIEQWLKKHPEHRPAWEVLTGARSVTDLIRDGDEESLAHHYLRLARASAQRGEWNEGLFLLEEAKYHARRAGIATLTPVINARLALTRSLAFREAGTPEPILHNSWKRLLELGCIEGRIEVLHLWGLYREATGDAKGAAALRAAVERRVRAWSEQIPAAGDPAALAAALGIELTQLPAYKVGEAVG